MGFAAKFLHLTRRSTDAPPAVFPFEGQGLGAMVRGQHLVKGAIHEITTDPADITREGIVAHRVYSAFRQSRNRHLSDFATESFFILIISHCMIFVDNLASSHIINAVARRCKPATASLCHHPALEKSSSLRPVGQTRSR
jgi:hypothetical protein